MFIEGIVVMVVGKEVLLHHGPRLLPFPPKAAICSTNPPTHTHIKTSMAALHAGKDYALGPRTWPNLVELTTKHHYVGWYLKSPKWNSYTNPGDISSETPLMSLSTWDRHPHLSASNFYLFRCALDGDDALRSLQSGDAEPGQTMDKT